MEEWFYCEPCDVTYLFRGNEVTGHREDDVEVRCRKCHAVLGHLRCDMYPPALLAKWSGQHRGRMPHE